MSAAGKTDAQRGDPSAVAPIGIIGGSGFYDLDELEDARRLIVRSPYGEPSAPLVFGRLNGVEVVFLARHGQGHTIPPHEVNYRANLYALFEQQVTTVLAVAAVGAISASISEGDLVICDQIIDYTYGRVATFVEPGQPVAHVEFTEPFTMRGRHALIEAADQTGIRVHRNGTYAATQGPRFETRAEIDRCERDGAHVVGMTGMPEAVLARELGLEYANVSLAVNPAAGRNTAGHDEISLDRIRQTLTDGMVVVRKLLGQTVRILHDGSAGEPLS